MSGLVDTWKTSHEQYGFSVVLLRLKKRSPLTSIVFDSAVTKFSP